MLNHQEGILKTLEMVKRRNQNRRERNRSITNEKEKRDMKEKTREENSEEGRRPVNIHI